MVVTSNSDKHNAALLHSAKLGFDYLFSNDIVGAKEKFAQSNDDPYHLLGLGVCAFLEAALGMESGLMTEAARCLTLSEAGSRKRQKNGNGNGERASLGPSRFPPGLEWEILVADAVVMLGLTHALSESYMGYLQCMYSLNNAHSKFTKLYKTVFPHGLDAYKTPAGTPPSSPLVIRKSSYPSLRSPTLPSSPSMSDLPSALAAPSPVTPNTNSGFSNMKQLSGFFGRWTSGQTSTTALPHVTVESVAVAVGGDPAEDGPVDELIVAGTAFGYGLFNLVFSLLPRKVQSVVGIFGFKHDRRLALQALAVSAEKNDAHSVFAGLVLMTYYGVVLLLLGYQANEAHVIKRYEVIVNRIADRYPQGALWILNKAKIHRLSHDPEAAIQVLQEGLRPERPHVFDQADTLLVFELAWTLLGQCRYQEAADTFIKITALNSWSHATYYFLAAGCYVSLGNLGKAQALLDKIPDLMNKKKISGKDPPTEVLIKKKLDFYKEKQRRRGGDEKKYAEVIKITTADELSIFWNAYSRIDKAIAQNHIDKWLALTPPLASPVSNNLATQSTTPSTSAIPNAHRLDDLDNVDEEALRSLLLGICYRTTGDYASSRACMKDACARQAGIRVSTWVPGVAMFETAVLDLKVVEEKERRAVLASVTEKRSGGSSVGLDVVEQEKLAGWEATCREEWERALTGASEKLDVALSLAPSTVDLSSRLDSRVTMLRDEIMTKREMLGIL